MLAHVKNGCATYKTNGMQKYAFQAQQTHRNMNLDRCNQQPGPPMYDALNHIFTAMNLEHHKNLFVTTKMRCLSNASKVTTEDVIGMVIGH